MGVACRRMCGLPSHTHAEHGCGLCVLKFAKNLHVKLHLWCCSDQGYVPSSFVQIQSTEETPVDPIQQLTHYEWVATVWNCVGQGIVFSVCPSAAFICSSGQILLPRCLMNGLSNLDETYREYRRQLNMALVFFGLILFCSIFCYGCMFTFVVFVSVSQYYCKSRDWLGRTSRKWPVLCRVGTKATTHTI